MNRSKMPGLALSLFCLAQTETGERRLVRSATIDQKGRTELHFYWPAP